MGHRASAFAVTLSTAAGGHVAELECDLVCRTLGELAHTRVTPSVRFSWINRRVLARTLTSPTNDEH